jgi:hypothetical protein
MQKSRNPGIRRHSRQLHGIGTEQFSHILLMPAIANSDDTPKNERF